MFRDNFDLAQPFQKFIHASGHRRGRRGFGLGFGGRGGGFMGDDGFPGGRKLSSSELQLILLSVLAEQPAHGYELIRMLEQHSGGFYTPSPGMIYPALTYLDEIGHAAVTQEGNRKLYSITGAGLDYLTANKVTADSILTALARIGRRMEQVREAFAGLSDADPQAADDLNNARHALKTALMHMRGCTPDEARRVTRILNEAAEQILKGRD
jgi:DNA-binding PadR family transcriptional regulator